MTDKALEKPQPDPLVQHRRDVRLKIVLPVMLSAVLLISVAIVLGVLAIFGDISSQQIGVMAACLAIVFVLLPLALLMFLVDALALVTGFAAGTLRGKLIKPFALLRGYSEEMSKVTAEAAEALTAPIIAVRTQSAFLRNFILGPLGFLDDEDKDNDKKPK